MKNIFCVNNIWIGALALELAALPAGAQTPAPEGYVSAAVSTVSTYAGQAWSAMTSWIPGSGGSSNIIINMKSHSETGELDFKNMMNVAGYALKTLESGVGLVPYFSMSFGKKREVSEADIEYLGRLLRKHARKNNSPVAFAERMIINAVMDLQKFEDYTLTKVEVDILPLPKVKFVAEPKKTTLSEEGRDILKAIEKLNARLGELHRTN